MRNNYAFTFIFICKFYYFTYIYSNCSRRTLRNYCTVNKPELIDTPIIEPRDNEVLVKTAFSTISCGPERANLTGSTNVGPGGGMPVARRWNLRPENEAWSPAEYCNIPEPI